MTSLMFFFPPPMTIMNFLLSQFATVIQGSDIARNVDLKDL